MVRSDKQLDSAFVNSDAWNSDEVSGNSGGKVDRYQLPEGMQAKMSFSGSERNSVFLKSQSGNFVNVSGNSGLDSNSDGRSVGIIDFDKDGRNDFLITNSNKPTLNVYRNEIGNVREQNNFVAVKVIGGNSTGEASTEYSNRDGIGSLIKVTSGKVTQMREVRCGEGLATQNSRTQLFGLGDNARAETITVRFPSGKTFEAKDIVAGSELTFREVPESGKEAHSVARYANAPPSIPTMAVNAAVKSPIKLPHESNGKHKVAISMATWCESCKSHIPDLALIKSELGDQVDLLAIPIDPRDTPEKLKSYLEKHTPAYELLSGGDSEQQVFTKFVADQLGSASVPFAIIVSPEGDVLRTMQGIPSISDLKSYLRHDVLNGPKSETRVTTQEGS